MDSLSSGTDVYLKKCDVLNRKLWAYDTSTIRAGTSGLCMTYATSSLSISPNDVIELTPCASAATWKWYDENIYGHEISEKNHYDKVHIVSMKKDADTSIETCLSVLSPSLNAHVIYTDCHLNDQKQVRGVHSSSSSSSSSSAGEYDSFHALSKDIETYLNYFILFAPSSFFFSGLGNQ